MKMQMAITGRGGQGVLFLTKILTECALRLGLEVIASEIHGMAVRGGSVVSTVKIGDFRGPLIRTGQADVILALDEGSIDAFPNLLSKDGILFLNARESNLYPSVDATGLASNLGHPVIANLVLLGFALSHGSLFCDFPQAESVVGSLSPERFREVNLEGLKTGYLLRRLPKK